MKTIKLILILIFFTSNIQHSMADEIKSPIGGPIVKILGNMRTLVTGPGHASVMVTCTTNPKKTCLFRKLSIDDIGNDQNEMCFPAAEIPDYNNIFDPNKNYIGLYDIEGNLNYTEVQKSTVISCNEDELIIEIIY